jgi:hypothetical protein
MEPLANIGELGVYGSLVFALVWVVRENTKCLIEVKHAIRELREECRVCRGGRSGHGRDV